MSAWVSRREWGARPARSASSLSNPQGSTAHWEGPRMGWFGHDACAGKVRGIQRFHMDSRGWADIAYTTVVCPHGYVFEGRGWFRRTAANGTNAGNNASYAHCYLGGQGDPFTVMGRQGMALAFRLARDVGLAGPRQWAHRDWKATECPGAEIVEFVRAGLPADLPEETDDMANYADQLNDIEAVLLDVSRRISHLEMEGDVIRRSLRLPLRQAVEVEYEERGLDIATAAETARERVARNANEIGEAGTRTVDDLLDSLDGIVARQAK